jgi:hypothetical protein
MTETLPNNNEFNAAEVALRKIGSNLWFGGLTDEWQDFLVSNTVETFDTYELSIDQAAQKMIEVFQQLLAADPSLLNKNPWETKV